MRTVSRILSSIFVGAFTLGLGLSAAHADRAETMKLRRDNPDIVKAQGGWNSVTTMERGRSGKVDVVKIYKLDRNTKQVTSVSGNLVPGAIAKVRSGVGDKQVSFRPQNGDGLSGLTRGGQIRVNVKGAREAKLVTVSLDAKTGAPRYYLNGDGSVKGNLAAAASKKEKMKGFDEARSRVTDFDGRKAVIVTTGRDKIPGQKYGSEIKSVRKLTVARDGATRSATGDLLPQARKELAKFEKNAGKDVTSSKLVGTSNTMMSLAFKNTYSNPDADMQAAKFHRGSRERLVRVTSYGTGKFANRGAVKSAKLLVTDSPNDGITTDR